MSTPNGDDIEQNQALALRKRFETQRPTWTEDDWSAVEKIKVALKNNCVDEISQIVEGYKDDIEKTDDLLSTCGQHIILHQTSIGIDMQRFLYSLINENRFYAPSIDSTPDTQLDKNPVLCYLAEQAAIVLAWNKDVNDILLYRLKRVALLLHNVRHNLKSLKLPLFKIVFCIQQFIRNHSSPNREEHKRRTTIDKLNKCVELLKIIIDNNQNRRPVSVKNLVNTHKQLVEETDQHFWELRDDYTVGKIKACWKRYSEGNRSTYSKLRTLQVLGECAKATPMSPNMSEELRKVCDSRDVATLIEIRNQICHFTGIPDAELSLDVENIEKISLSLRMASTNTADAFDFLDHMRRNNIGCEEEMELFVMLALNHFKETEKRLNANWGWHRERYPTLTGDQLRNHLAHDDVIVHLLGIDVFSSVKATAKELVNCWRDESTEKNRIQRLTRASTIDETRDKDDEEMKRIEQYEELRNVLIEGDLDAVKEFVVTRKDWRLWKNLKQESSIHWAAANRQDNLELFEFALEQTQEPITDRRKIRAIVEVADRRSNKSIVKHVLEIVLSAYFTKQHGLRLIRPIIGNVQKFTEILRSKGSRNSDERIYAWWLAAMHGIYTDNPGPLAAMSDELYFLTLRDARLLCNDLTLFHVACKLGSIGVVRHFIETGFDINCTVRGSSTPSFYAKQRNVAELLQNNGATRHAGNVDCPMHAAVKTGDFNAIKDIYHSFPHLLITRFARVAMPLEDLPHALHRDVFDMITADYPKRRELFKTVCKYYIQLSYYPLTFETRLMGLIAEHHNDRTIQYWAIKLLNKHGNYAHANRPFLNSILSKPRARTRISRARGTLMLRAFLNRNSRLDDGTLNNIFEYILELIVVYPKYARRVYYTLLTNYPFHRWTLITSQAIDALKHYPDNLYVQKLAIMVLRHSSFLKNKPKVNVQHLLQTVIEKSLVNDIVIAQCVEVFLGYDIFLPENDRVEDLNGIIKSRLKEWFEDEMTRNYFTRKVLGDISYFWAILIKRHVKEEKIILNEEMPECTTNCKLDPEMIENELSKYFNEETKLFKYLLETVNNDNAQREDHSLMKRMRPDICFYATKNDLNIENCIETCTWRKNFYKSMKQLLQRHGMDEADVMNVMSKTSNRSARLTALKRHQQIYPNLPRACHARDLNAVKELVKYDGSLRADGWRCLMICAGHGHLAMMRVLLDCDIKTDVPAGYMWTPLLEACQCGHADLVDELFRRNKYVNSTDENGATCLHIAARNGHVELVQILREHGVDVNVPNRISWTPLWYASQAGHLSVVRKLIELGADVNWPDKHDATCLHAAAMSRNCDLIRELIRTHCLDVNATDAHGTRPLHEACRAGHLAVVRLLIQLGADVAAVSERDQTCLYVAAQCGHADLVRELRHAHGLDPNAPDDLGWRPLHIAAVNGHLDVARTLIRLGADLNAAAADGRTCLHSAAECWNDNSSLVRELIQVHGIDANATDDVGSTPLHYACGAGRLYIVRLLVQLGADRNPVTKSGDTCLHAAARSRNSALIQEMIESHGIGVNVADHDGWTPLHVALFCGEFRNARELIRRGADVNAVTENGENCLHSAARSGKSGFIFELIREHGIDVNATDRHGETPLHYAHARGHLDIARKLIELGAVT